MRTALKPPVDNGNIVPLGNLKYMPKFYKWIKNQPLNEILTLSLNKIDLAVINAKIFITDMHVNKILIQ
jgi:hypothetical protein